MTAEDREVVGTPLRVPAGLVGDPVLVGELAEVGFGVVRVGAGVVACGDVDCSEVGGAGTPVEGLTGVTTGAVAGGGLTRT